MTVAYVAVWLAFGLLLSVIVQRAATAALVGLRGVDGGRHVRSIPPQPGARHHRPGEQQHRRSTRRWASISCTPFVLRLLPTTLYSEGVIGPAQPVADGDQHPGNAGPVDAGAATDPDPALARPEPAPGLAAPRGTGGNEGHLLRDRLCPLHAAKRSAPSQRSTARAVPSQPPCRGGGIGETRRTQKSGERKLVAGVRLPPPATKPVGPDTKRRGGGGPLPLVSRDLQGEA